MKKYGKLLPLFFVAPLLMSCGNVKVKKPEFAEKGSEKTHTEFYSAYKEVSMNSAMAKEDLLPSATIEESSVMTSSREEKRSDKVITSRKSATESSKKTQIDMSSVVIHSEEKETETAAEKDASNVSSSQSVKKEKKDYQEFKGAEKTYLVSVDENEQTYSQEAEVPAEKTTAYSLDQKARSLMGGIMPYEVSALIELIAVLPPEAEVLEGYKFYQNEKVFTIEFNEKVENEESKNVENEVLTVTNRSEEKVFQFDLTDGAMAIKVYKHETSTVEYKKIYSGHAAGDIVVSESEEAKTATYNYDSKVKLAAVDLSKFVALSELK